MVASLGGVGILTAVVGIAIVALNAKRGSDEPVATVAQESEGESVVGDEANPEFVSLEANPPEPSNASEPATSPLSNDDAARQLAAIKTWNSLSKTQSQGFKNLVRFEVTAVWLAADATGKPIGMKASAAAPVAAAANGGAAPPATPKLEAAEAPAFVFAELRITNTGTKPLKYTGWNNASAAAILADQSGSPLEFVPASATPDIARQATIFIPPGDSIDDTLVFRAPQNAVQTLRLALPHVALSPLSKGHFALEVPPEMLFEEPSRANAPGLAGGGSNQGLDAAQREFAALQQQLAEGESPGPAPPEPKPAEPASSPSPAPAAGMSEAKTDAKPNTAKPPSAEDLDKLFRETDSAETSDETKPTEADAD